MNILDDWMTQTFGHANNHNDQGNPALGVFVVGTDTDVGKTYVSCLIVRQLAEKWNIGVYKPVASGLRLDGEDDPERLSRASGQLWPAERVCPQRFRAPLAPPLAAQRENRFVDGGLLADGARWWHGRCDLLWVESAGGALSPLSSHSTVLDLAIQLGFPILLVAAHRLGMMNHTLLTLEAIRKRNLSVLALVINETSPTVDESPLQLSDTVKCLAAFCDNLPCWSVKYASSTLSREPT